MRELLVVLLVVCFSVSSVTASDDSVPVPPVEVPDGDILFSDNFEGYFGHPDSKKWQFVSPTGQNTQFTGGGRLTGDGVVMVSAATPKEPEREPEKGAFDQDVLESIPSFRLGAGAKLMFRARLKIPHSQKGLRHTFQIFNAFDHSGIERTNKVEFQWQTNNTVTEKSSGPKISSASYWKEDEDTEVQDRKSKWGALDSEHIPLLEDSAEWQTYTIIWSKGKVEYFVDTADGKMKSIGAYTGKEVPRGRLKLRFKTTVPTVECPEAYNKDLWDQYENGAASHKGLWPMLVDWVEVSQI